MEPAICTLQSSFNGDMSKTKQVRTTVLAHDTPYMTHCLFDSLIPVKNFQLLLDVSFWVEPVLSKD